MKRTLSYVTLVAVLLLSGMYFYRSLTIQHIPPSPSVQIGDRFVRVTVVNTAEERQQGLSGRESLGLDEGMLFVFPKDGRYGFWMKDMHFSIDILWLSAEGRVVYMAQNVSPDTYPQAFQPDTPARYVLELPAGYAGAHAVSVGDIVRL